MASIIVSIEVSKRALNFSGVSLTRRSKFYIPDSLMFDTILSSLTLDTFKGYLSRTNSLVYDF